MLNASSAAMDAINSIALEIIMHAGDARLCISEAVKAAAEGNFPATNEKLEEAKKKLAIAHGLQTDIVQSEGEGTKHDHTLLFIHAQDTLMTIYSEMNMVRQLKSVFRRYEERITELERRIFHG
ncbi:MAG: PTS lactose/cellobiose transporter subunit IIA [Treponema sp.]|jgi:PTS system cellobiose-specific IIA component|nr:PTS lactose/cellobiose transporter subunit IIA [Treponema sp.]